MVYLSATTRQFFEEPDYFGCMFNAIKWTGKQKEALEAGCIWMLDNGAFSKKFTEDAWLKALPKFTKYIDTCKGVIVPDVVFDYKRTLENFYRYHEIVRSYGYPVALATQNGMTASMIPWDLIDVLFIGGDHHHKRHEAQALAWQAKKRGKWVHVGRVQSKYRIMSHYQWADSVDGSTFKHHPTQQKAGIMEAIDARKVFQWQLL